MIGLSEVNSESFSGGFSEVFTVLSWFTATMIDTTGSTASEGLVVIGVPLSINMGLFVEKSYWR